METSALPDRSRSPRNVAFDKARGIGAVMVVLIHAPPFIHSSVPSLQRLGWLVQMACLTAVPFFFLLSGWFLGRKAASESPDSDTLRRSVSRLAGLYVPWFVFFLGLDIATGLPHDAWTVLRRFIGFSEAKTDTTGYHLWFLPSLVLAQWISWRLLRWTRSAIPAVVAGIALWIVLSARDIAGMGLPWNLVPHEGIDMSLACVAVGLWMGQRDFRISGALPWIGLGSACLLLEGFAVERLTGLRLALHPFLLTRLFVPALLLSALAGAPGWLSGGRPGKILDFLGTHSTGIYVAHLAFLVLVPFERWVPNGFVRDNVVRWPVTVAGSILVSMALGRAPWKPLRKLVS